MGIVSWTWGVLARTGSNLDIIPRQEVGDETKSCLVTTETEMSASLLRLTQSLLHSSVCTNLLGLIVWGSLDSDNLNSFNVFILPILQLGMSALSEKIQRILRSRLQAETESSSNSEEKIHENRIKLREILSDQHRLMYYTVTISSLHTTTRLRKDSRNLRWQLASTLCKSQATMRKSTINSPSYYTLAYLGEILEDDESDQEILEFPTDDKEWEKPSPEVTDICHNN